MEGRDLARGGEKRVSKGRGEKGREGGKKGKWEDGMEGMVGGMEEGRETQE